MCCIVFFFKQKTAYEMRISDWSSDVCSSDLPAQRAEAQALRRRQDWQMIQWNRAATAQPDNGAAQFVRLLRDPAVLRERDLFERVLAVAGIPPDQPAGRVMRAAARRGGTEVVCTCRIRWVREYSKQTNIYKTAQTT